MEKVAVVGASPKQERYSNKAIRMLKEFHHTPVPVAPGHEVIEKEPVFESLDRISEKIDTVTVYLSPARQENMMEQIIDMAPKRVIFNPGTENPTAKRALESAGITVVEACTLVMLKTNQF